MKQYFFTLYDSKGEYFLKPTLARSANELIRSLRTLLSEDDSDIAKYPEDYTLFEIASFDDQTGRVEVLSTPKSICILNALVASAD